MNYYFSGTGEQNIATGKNAIGKQVTTTVTQTNISQTVKGSGNIASGSGNITINGNDITCDSIYINDDNIIVGNNDTSEQPTVEDAFKDVKDYLAEKYGEDSDVYIACCVYEKRQTSVTWLEAFNEELTALNLYNNEKCAILIARLFNTISKKYK